jgi:hypothetical protein
MLFMGDGKGGFKYVPQWQSGLDIRENVRSIEVIAVGNSLQLIFEINNSSAKSITLQ